MFSRALPAPSLSEQFASLSVLPQGGGHLTYKLLTYKDIFEMSPSVAGAKSFFSLL
jgi:hypothetical protein